MRKDYKTREMLSPAPQKKPARRWWIGLAASAALLGVVIANSKESPGNSSISSASSQAELPHGLITATLPIPGHAASNSPTENSILPLIDAKQETAVTDASSSSLTQKQSVVKPGDTLSTLFAAAGASNSDMLALLKTDSSLRKIYPGNIINFNFDAAGQLMAVTLHHDQVEHTEYHRTESGFKSEKKSQPLEVRVTHAQGEIKQSLFLAGKRAGISENTIMDLAFIFGWDIDFALDVRDGDRFALIYEQLYQNGDFVREGNILAAEFVNQGTVYQAIRFDDPETGRGTYFAPDGSSLRKAFLRSPLNFTRITSGFTTKRYHPVLHKMRAHKGVDYGAARGTPVWSTGDGKVVFKGKKGGYGNVIIIKHGSAYSTLYGHLNGFAKGIQTGSKVDQGQTIGYVGSTGLATGPHLHYEFQINGVHHDPLSVKFPGVGPIPQQQRAAFNAVAEPMLAQLAVLEKMLLAQNQPQ